MFAIINNMLKIINTIEPNIAKFVVTTFNKMKNLILVYKLF